MSDKPWSHKQPKAYTLGTGHCLWFYDKLDFLADRHRAIVQEMLNRGYKPGIMGCLREEWQERISKAYWQGYNATDTALAVNQERIDKRLAGDKT